MTAPLSARAVIERLDLRSHPEGGWFAETFRDTVGVGAGGRAASTAIYYLLEAGSVSAWHRVRDAAEVWHHYAGAPLRLSLAADLDGPVAEHLLGPDIEAGQRPQAVCPRGVWQSAVSLGAASLGEWTLCGCTVAPGFQFASFELAPRPR